ncbi:hypothetical protein [Microbacterium sp.]|uniref:hypothetical protein n=1 Tax=Microbacterium sp. TaxID=51671 RepID=UPI003A88B337
MSRTWIAYSVTGAIGLGIVAGGAAAAAAAMDLRTADDQVLPGGAISGPQGDVLEQPTVQLRVTGSAVELVTAATPAQLTAITPAEPADSVDTVAPGNSDDDEYDDATDDDNADDDSVHDDPVTPPTIVSAPSA